MGRMEGKWKARDWRTVLLPSDYKPLENDVRAPEARINSKHAQRGHGGDSLPLQPLLGTAL